MLFREFPPGFKGGAPVIIYEMFSRLRQIPLLISTSRTDSPEGEELLDWARVHRHRFLSTMVDPDFCGWPRPLKFVLRYLVYLVWNLAVLVIGMSNRIDFLFLGRFDYVYPAALLLRRLRNLPLIVLFYGEEITQVNRGATADWRLHRRFFGPFVRRVDLPLFLSETARRQMQQEGLIKGGGVLPPGVDSRTLRPPEDKDLMRMKFAPDADLLLLFLGRLVERKGPDRVIEAFSRLHAEYPGARLIIAGSGPMEEPLIQLAHDLGLDLKIRFTGEIPYQSPQRVELFQAADIFLMPNRRTNLGDLEGFGIVFLEANACGVPVIGGNNGGVPEAVIDGRTGYLVDTEEVGPLTKALDRLMGDTVLRERLGMQGRKRVKEDYSWERTAMLFEAYLDGLNGSEDQP